MVRATRQSDFVTPLRFDHDGENREFLSGPHALRVTQKIESLRFHVLYSDWKLVMTADNQPRCALVTFAGRDFRVHGEYAMRFDVRFDVHQHFSAAYSMTVWVAGREPTELHKAAKVVVCPWIYERYRLPLDRLACAKAIVTLEVLINGEQAALDNPRTPTRRPPISRIRRVVQSLIDAGAGSSDPPSLRFWREYGR